MISRQQKSPIAGKESNTKQLVDTTFWLEPWLKLTSFGSNSFHLAKELATTTSEPGYALIFSYAGGYYMCIETYSPRHSGDKARLIGPSISGSGLFYVMLLFSLMQVDITCSLRPPLPDTAVIRLV